MGEATRFTVRSQGASGAVAEIEAALGSSLRRELEVARWYQGKGRPLSSLALVDLVVVPEASGGMLAIVAAGYDDGGREDYALALAQGCERHGSRRGCG